MSTDRILGYLAQRFSPSEENVASEALTWLAGRSTEANAAVVRLAWPDGSNAPADLTFIGQVGNAGSGRPDITGSDPSGRVRLLIEAKFAAGLTPQQPGKYLDLLSVDTESVLLVVAPTARRETLWAELLRGVPDLAPTAPPPSVVLPDGVLRVTVGEHRTLALASWRHVVTAVLEALRAADQWELAHDAEQLLGLTEAMDNAAFIPLRGDDLGWRTAQQIGYLHSFIDNIHNRIAADSASPAETLRRNPSHGRMSYGWYLRSRKSHKAIWYGFRASTWTRYGKSPLWVRVTVVTPKWSRQRLLHALGGLDQPGQSGVFEDSKENFFFIPLEIPHFSGEEDVAVALRSQVERVITMLDAAVLPGEEPVTDEPEVTDSDVIEDEEGT